MNRSRPQTNPYSWNKVSLTLFYGQDRHRLLAEMVECLPQGESFMVFAGRGMGKTTMLRNVEVQLRKKQNIHIVYVDGHCAPQLGSSSEAFAWLLSQVKAGDHSKSEKQLREEHSIEVGTDAWTEWFSRRSGQFVFLIDEAETFIRPEWKQIFYNNLSYALRNSPGISERLSIVLTGGSPLEDSYYALGSPLAAATSIRHLSVLDEVSAYALMNEPTDGMLPARLQDAIYEGTGGHPSLVQYILGQLCQTGWAEGLISIKESEARLIRDQDPIIRRCWFEHLTERERNLYRWLVCRKEASRAEITAAMGFPPGMELDRLVFSGFVADPEHKQKYRVTGTILQRWIKDNDVMPLKDKSAALNKERDEVLFAWIHLSDIHFGHGSVSHQWDQRWVLELLRRDMGELLDGEEVPWPDAAFVTGDISFSGNCRSPDEFARASDWLSAIGDTARLKNHQIFVIPGNHDVQRRADQDRNISRLLKDLRSGEQPLDDALSDNAVDRVLLSQRQANYLSFAADFAPACCRDAEQPGAQLYWRHRLQARQGLLVRILGLNSALLCADEQDQGKLRLGREQITRSILNPLPLPNEVVLVLSHHPFVGGWLADEEQVSLAVRNHTDAHLSGHVHVADMEGVRAAAGRTFVRLVAGAAHGDSLPSGVPPEHGYSFAAIIRTKKNQILLRQWPRRWSNRNQIYLTHIDITLRNKNFAEYELPRIRL